MALPTAAVIFRTAGSEVLLLDEADTLRNQDDMQGAILQVLNLGFEAEGVVRRCEKDSDGAHRVLAYPVYGPKAFAGLEALADTLSDRTFVVQMERASHKKPRFVEHRLSMDFQGLRERIDKWAVDSHESLKAIYDQLPDEHPDLARFDDRFQDISEPLVVIATLADNERPKGCAILPRLLEGLQAASVRREMSNRERAFLAFLDIAQKRLNLIESEEDEIFVSSDSFLSDCEDREELNWIENGKSLAGLVKKFDLPSVSNGKRRGYRLSQRWIEKWRKRYGDGRSHIQQRSAEDASSSTGVRDVNMSNAVDEFDL
jgi:hypothetical protein